MAQTALKEPVVDKSSPVSQKRDPERERLARESDERYSRYAAEVNHTRDSDIEKTLRG